jgi:hypothetical protein
VCGGRRWRFCPLAIAAYANGDIYRNVATDCNGYRDTYFNTDGDSHGDCYSCSHSNVDAHDHGCATHRYADL